MVHGGGGDAGTTVVPPSLPSPGDTQLRVYKQAPDEGGRRRVKTAKLLSK